MSELNHKFRDELLSMESQNQMLREKYDKELKAMIEQKLTAARKFSSIAMLIVSLLLAIFFTVTAITVPKDFPLWGRFMFAAGAVFGLAFAGVMAWTLKKGTTGIRSDQKASVGLSWGLVILMGTVTLVFSGKMPDRIKAVQMLVNILFFMIGAAVMLLHYCIERSELNVKEKLLELELKLAQIDEKISRKQ